jgi:hypothetical protein
MSLSSPKSFREALARLSRPVMGTLLKSVDLQELGAQVTERSFFSAQTTLGSYLDEVKKRVEDILNPRTEMRDDVPFTAGINPATARLELKQLLERLGYQPDPEKRGTIEDLSSDRRIDLVVDHNVAEAAGYGQYIQGQDPEVLDLYPAQELVRVEERKEPRNWKNIWLSAAAEVGDEDAARVFRQTGRMVARKDSPIWEAISDFGRPWPPFKWGSGMGLEDRSRKEAMALGLVGLNDKIIPGRKAFNIQEAA